MPERNIPTGGEQPLARPLDEQQLARPVRREQEEAGHVEGAQQVRQSEEKAPRAEEERQEVGQAGREQKEKGFADRAVDKVQEKGLVDEQTAQEAREKSLIEKIKDKLTGR